VHDTCDHRCDPELLVDTIVDADATATGAAHDQDEAAAADHAAQAQDMAERTARRARRQDTAAWAALIAGLLISLTTFGLIAYENSVSQHGGSTPTGTSVASTG
jgi:formate/nitrite transporter FocA (FNT family)